MIKSEKLGNICIVVVSIIAILILLWDGELRYQRKVENSCSYKLPKYYQIVQDTISKKYAIEYTGVEGKYYFSKQFSNITPYGSKYDCEIFIDSCEAKLFVREYFELLESDREFIKVE